MPLFMVKREAFELCKLGQRDVELRAVRPQWKNSKPGDIATFQCGREIFRKRITRIHRGTLALIFLKIDYKRIFPKASTVFEAVRATREFYPKTEDFIAFELDVI